MNVDAILDAFDAPPPPPPPPVPHPWPVVACGSCEAPIVWTYTKAGKRMPVDAHGDLGGNVLVRESKDARRGLDSWPTPKGLGPWICETTYTGGILRTVSHFATCPNAHHHRKD